MAKSGPAGTISSVEVVDLWPIGIEFARKHQLRKLAIASRWPGPRTSNAVKVAIEDARVASVGVEQDEGIGKGDKPRFDRRLERLAFLGIMILHECLRNGLALCPGDAEAGISYHGIFRYVFCECSIKDPSQIDPSSFGCMG